MRLRITFLGAAGTVTGSKFLVETGRARVLVDCGLFQGDKELRERNWRPLPVDPSSLDSIVVTHAHLDHVGFLPAVVRDGFSGPVFASGSTARMAEVVMADSGRIQEEDAERANRKGYTKHKPALPLYTERDAERASQRFRFTDWETSIEAAPGVRLTLRRAGHILGSAAARLEMEGTSVMFSGDLGRPYHPILAPPEAPLPADTVVVESTYGDTEHLEEDATAELGEVISRTAERGGTVVIPAFAIDRTEVILHSLTRLAATSRIPPLPVFLDSPMARSALGLYTRAIVEHHYDIREEVRGHPEVMDPGDLRIVETVDESKAINQAEPPFVVISASGMATGGRVLHHLARALPDPKSSVILVGYQAIGTRGASLRDGADKVRIHGQNVPVRAEIHSVPAFSVHADRSELVDWLQSMPARPTNVIAVHGDPEASAGLAREAARLGAPVRIPGDGETLEL